MMRKAVEKENRVMRFQTWSNDDDEWEKKRAKMSSKQGEARRAASWPPLRRSKRVEK